MAVTVRLLERAEETTLKVTDARRAVESLIESDGPSAPIYRQAQLIRVKRALEGCEKILGEVYS